MSRAFKLKTKLIGLGDRVRRRTLEIVGSEWVREVRRVRLRRVRLRRWCAVVDAILHLNTMEMMGRIVQEWKTRRIEDRYHETTPLDLARVRARTAPRRKL
jgi:hypothetical protein